MSKSCRFVEIVNNSDIPVPQCVMPPNSKRSRAVLVNFDDFDGECQPSKRKKKGLDLIAVDDWII